MANLTANKPRKFAGDLRTTVAYDCSANLEYFVGAALLRDGTTYLPVAVTPTASGHFLGFAEEYKDNRTGSPFGGTAASTTVQIAMRGHVYLTVDSGGTWARSNTGATVYASDNDTFTLSAGTNNILIGKVVYVPTATVGAASGEVLVYFESTAHRSI